MKIGLIVVGAMFALVAALGICGYAIKRVYFSPETKREAMERYRSQIEEKYQECVAAAKKLPGRDQVTSPKQAKLDPPPSYGIGPAQDQNVAVFLEDGLFDPKAWLLQQKKFDIDLPGALRDSLWWTKNRYPMYEYRLDEPAGEFPLMFENALRCRYLVVLRPLEYRAPKSLDLNSSKVTRTFAPGSVKLDVFVIDLHSSDLVAACQVSSETDANFKVAANISAESAQVQLQTGAWTNLRSELGKVLSQCTGGKFRF